MDNDELWRAKSEEQAAVEDGAVSVAPLKKYVVFYLAERRYAFEAEVIREIVITEDVYYVPFVPPCVKGLINRHGEPHAVIDPRVLLEGKHTEGSKFLVLNRKHDRIAFAITEIGGIHRAGEAEFSRVEAKQEDKDLFQGSLRAGGEDVLVLDPDLLLQRVANDLKP